MSCETVRLQDGTPAIVCGRGRRALRCAWCDAASRYQCDAKVHPRTSKTCSAHLCETHAVHVGANRHLCLRHAEGAPRQEGLMLEAAR